MSANTRVELVVRIVKGVAEGPPPHKPVTEVIVPLKVDWVPVPEFEQVEPTKEHALAETDVLAIVSNALAAKVKDIEFDKIFKVLLRQGERGLDGPVYIFPGSDNRAVLYVDVGDLLPEDAIRYLEKVREAYKKIDSADVTFVPVRGGKSA